MSKMKHFKVVEKISVGGMNWVITLSTDSNKVDIYPADFLHELSRADITTLFNKVEAAMLKLRRKAGRPVAFLNFPLTATDLENEVQAGVAEELAVKYQQEMLELQARNRKQEHDRRKHDEELIAFLTDLLECG